MTLFLQNAPHDLTSWALRNMFDFLGATYAAREDIKSFETAQRWQGITRKSGEPLRDFWVSWTDGMRLAREQECLENSSALFCKSLRSLYLNAEQTATVRLMKLTWCDPGRRLDAMTVEVLKRWIDDFDEKPIDGGTPPGFFYQHSPSEKEIGPDNNGLAGKPARTRS